MKLVLLLFLTSLVAAFPLEVLKSYLSSEKGDGEAMKRILQLLPADLSIPPYTTGVKKNPWR